jgi:Domain of unknown function DUF29
MAIANQVISHKDLYKLDFYLWLEQAAILLRAGNLKELDLENLVDEIECMGRSEKRRIVSNLEIIIIHLLKYKFQPEKRSNSWLYTLLEHRRRLYKDFIDSPSLKRYFIQEFADAYLGARKLAALETEININIFPLDSPFTPDQVLDEDFLPDN